VKKRGKRSVMFKEKGAANWRISENLFPNTGREKKKCSPTGKRSAAGDSLSKREKRRGEGGFSGGEKRANDCSRGKREEGRKTPAHTSAIRGRV